MAQIDLGSPRPASECVAKIHGLAESPPASMSRCGNHENPRGHIAPTDQFRRPAVAGAEGSILVELPSVRQVKLPVRVLIRLTTIGERFVQLSPGDACCDARYSLACPRGKYLAALAASVVRTRAAPAITAPRTWAPMTYRDVFMVLSRAATAAAFRRGASVTLGRWSGYSGVACLFLRCSGNDCRKLAPSRLSRHLGGFAPRSAPAIAPTTSSHRACTTRLLASPRSARPSLRPGSSS